jgi:hypothetical protein
MALARRAIGALALQPAARPTRAVAAAPPPPAPPRRRRRRPPRDTRRGTSEFWYEEEPEYDAVTDALLPKLVAVVAAPAADAGGGGAEALAALRACLAPAPLAAAFAGAGEAEFARALWAGRDGPPYFLKVKAREALGAGAAGGADAFFAEALEQNWAVLLDAGLGQETRACEWLLVVCAPAAAEALLERCCPGAGAGVAPGAVAVLAVSGTEAGAPAGWERLRVALARAPAPPRPGEALDAAALAAAPPR